MVEHDEKARDLKDMHKIRIIDMKYGSNKVITFSTNSSKCNSNETSPAVNISNSKKVKKGTNSS